MIGVCKHCSCTDTLVPTKRSAGEPVACEWCAEEDRREHDDYAWDEPDLGDVPDERP